MQQSFDEHTIAKASEVATVTDEQMASVRAMVSAGLGRGSDAWPAVQWLAGTSDLKAKKRLLADLNAVLSGASTELLSHDAAVHNFSSDIVFGRATRDRQRISRAFDFAAALLASIPRSTESVTNLEFEQQVAQRRLTADAHEARTEELHRLGVRAGEGLPFHELYMRRRSKKSWESSGG